MRLFGHFADSKLNSKVERPCGRLVEMPGSHDTNSVYSEMA
jgi:hypothetical protein